MAPTASLLRLPAAAAAAHGQQAGAAVRLCSVRFPRLPQGTQPPPEPRPAQKREPHVGAPGCTGGGGARTRLEPRLDARRVEHVAADRLHVAGRGGDPAGGVGVGSLRLACSDRVGQAMEGGLRAALGRAGLGALPIALVAAARQRRAAWQQRGNAAQHSTAQHGAAQRGTAQRGRAGAVRTLERELALVLLHLGPGHGRHAAQVLVARPQDGLGGEAGGSGGRGQAASGSAWSGLALHAARAHRPPPARLLQAGTRRACCCCLPHQPASPAARSRCRPRGPLRRQTQWACGLGGPWWVGGWIGGWAT